MPFFVTSPLLPTLLWPVMSAFSGLAFFLFGHRRFLGSIARVDPSLFRSRRTTTHLIELASENVTDRRPISLAPSFRPLDLDCLAASGECCFGPFFVFFSIPRLPCSAATPGRSPRGTRSVSAWRACFPLRVCLRPVVPPLLNTGCWIKPPFAVHFFSFDFSPPRTASLARLAPPLRSRTSRFFIQSGYSRTPRTYEPFFLSIPLFFLSTYNEAFQPSKLPLFAGKAVPVRTTFPPLSSLHVERWRSNSHTSVLLQACVPLVVSSQVLRARASFFPRAFGAMI